MQQEVERSFADPQVHRLGAIAAKYQLDPLGVGGRRIAVACGDNQVAKIAWKREGLVDNEIEWRLWQGADQELRDLLCPCLDLLDGGALIQARCLPSAQSDSNLVRRLASYGISDAAINLGIYNQRLVCYDYCLLRPERLKQIIEGEKNSVLRLDSLR